MSPVPASGVVSSGQILEMQSETPLQAAGRVFGKTEEATNSQAPSAPNISQQTAPTSPVSLSLSASPADVLKPKLAHAGTTLSDLNSRASEMKPTNAAGSLQNRLDLLNTQFRALGNSLEDSAAKNDPMQLLRLQNDIYQLDEELELVSKVVEQATSGVRTLLQTQL